jgi:hypothetical protein
MIAKSIGLDLECEDYSDSWITCVTDGVLRSRGPMQVQAKAYACDTQYRHSF